MRKGAGKLLLVVKMCAALVPLGRGWRCGIAQTLAFRSVDTKFKEITTEIGVQSIDGFQQRKIQRI